MEKTIKIQPFKILPNRVWRTYTGGHLIDRMYDRKGNDTNFPEEWIASCTMARNAGREELKEGISELILHGEKNSLVSLIEKFPAQFLGQAHVETFGTSLAILAKIIDSAERLTIQCHPDKPTAKELFQSDFGKAECWHILDTRQIDDEEAYILLGFKEGVTEEEFIQTFKDQDIQKMVDCLHKFKVKKGDTYFISGGVPHAIGPGCMLIELQEPTDLTIRTEKITPNGLHIDDSMIHQGLGFDDMFKCFSFDNYSAEQIQTKWKVEADLLGENESFRHELLLGSEHTDNFRMEKVSVYESFDMKPDNQFSIIKIVDGQGELTSDNELQSFTTGTEFFIPASCPSISFSGEFTMIVVYPPFSG